MASLLYVQGEAVIHLRTDVVIRHGCGGERHKAISCCNCRGILLNILSMLCNLHPQFIEKASLKRGDLLCLVAFGSGFTWGSVLMRW